MNRPRTSLSLAFALFTLSLAACDERPAHPSPGKLEGAQVDKLRELGYSDYSLEAADAKRVGVVLNDAARSQPGCNLISLGKRAEALLFDAQGTELKRWSDPQGRNWDHVELCDNGDLLVVGANEGTRKQSAAVCDDHYLARYSWNGALLWKAAHNAHHDVQFTPRRQMVSLTAGLRYVPEYDKKFQVVDNWIELFDLDGRRLAALSLYDLLTDPAAEFELVRAKPNPDPKFPLVDLIHANSVEWMSRTELYGKHPIFAASNVLVCMRHQDAVVVVDCDAKKIVWSWGRGEISGAHDARVLPDGHLLIYDNGLERGWSRVIEVDPWTAKIVWEYHAPQPKDFFSSGQGSSQRLANGNTLVCNSLAGQAFEVTPTGEHVWEYLVPYFDERGHRATMYRIRRYDTAFIERLLNASR